MRYFTRPFCHFMPALLFLIILFKPPVSAQDFVRLGKVGEWNNDFGLCNTSGYAQGIAIPGDHIYVADGMGGLGISDPSSILYNSFTRAFMDALAPNFKVFCGLTIFNSGK